MRNAMIFLCSLAINFALNSADLKKNQLSFIIEDHINLREKPDVNSNKVTTLNQFAKVKILEINPKIVTIKKWKGRWIKVQSEEKTGFVLDCFLMKNHESISEIAVRDSYWEIGSGTYQIGKMSPDGEIDTQGVLSFSKDLMEKVSWGTGEGEKSCFYLRIFSAGNKILILCDKYKEEPDHNEEGERTNVLILLEKMNNSSLKILNFGFDL